MPLPEEIERRICQLERGCTEAVEACISAIANVTALAQRVAHIEARMAMIDALADRQLQTLAAIAETVNADTNRDVN